jgi:hypothetical protein
MPWSTHDSMGLIHHPGVIRIIREVPVKKPNPSAEVKVENWCGIRPSRYVGATDCNKTASVVVVGGCYEYMFPF